MSDLTQAQINFKDAAKHFPTGVVVAIANHNNSWHGMTISAFTTISLDPLLIMIAVSKKAKMHDVLLQDEDYKFSVNILDENQQNISDHFSGQKTIDDIDSQVDVVSDFTILKNYFAYFLCKVTDAIDKGDHTLFFGKVIYSKSCADNARQPLVYYSRSYAKIKSEI